MTVDTLYAWTAVSKTLNSIALSSSLGSSRCGVKAKRFMYMDHGERYASMSTAGLSVYHKGGSAGVVYSRAHFSRFLVILYTVKQS